MRRILGLEAASDDERNALTPVLRRLVERGLAGMRLVISGAREGRVVAIRETLLDVACAHSHNIRSPRLY